ncbi:MAG: allantoicase [Myxococcaceae bacterium]|nr:allantoicase [Myxococcaceae bacterium]
MGLSAVPEVFNGLVDLCADSLGAFALYATDDYFAEKENLLKPGAPQWLEGKYTDKGKWMDGWESQRRRSPGHDFCVVRLGVPGQVHGALVDTTHFKGNAPTEISLEGIEADDDASVESLLASQAWVELLPKTAVKPDFPNVVTRTGPSSRITHVRLHIFPDGGVARLRVYGTVVPLARTFWREASVDLGAVENGGKVVAVSDTFFGPASNLLLPGRGVNMGDGWETKRRRTPGSDWAVIELGRRGVVDQVELDTHFFKGNAPQATTILALDASKLKPKALTAKFSTDEGWAVLIDAPLVQHRRHALTPERPVTATHLKVHIFPHGGVNRLRLWGHAVDTDDEAAKLVRLNQLSADAAREVLLGFCGSFSFADRLVAARPFDSLRALFATAQSTWWELDEGEWLTAYAAHPRLGDAAKGKAQTEQSSHWSKAEQQSIQHSQEAILEGLRKANEQYLSKFGFIFICFASGKSGEQVLAILERRLQNERAVEIENAAREQAKITRRRIEKWVNG